MQEGATATNPQTGERIVMRGGRWQPLQAAPAPAPQAPSAPPRPLPAPPRPVDPYQAAQEQRAASGEARADTSLGLSIDSNARAARSEERQAGNDQFARFQALRDDFERNPIVQNYNTVISQYASALNTAPDAAGDLALIYSFAKVMDPGSVVRESEMDMAASTSNTAQQIATRFGFEIGANGRISPETRTRLLRELHNRAVQANRSYNQFRSRTAADATASGVDPERVLGPHAGLPYLGQIRDYLSRNNAASSTPLGPGATNPNAFLSPDDFITNEQALGQSSPQNMPRMTPEQEASFSQFVRDNAGRMTPDLLNQWAAQNGAGWTFDLTSPDVQRWVNAINRGEQAGTSPNYSVSDQQYLQQFEDRARAEGLRSEGSGGVGQSVDAFVRGAADTATLGLADEIAGLADTVGGGTYQQNVDYQRYIDTRDAENNGISRFAGQFTGGIVGPGGRVASAARTVGPGRAAIEGAVLGGLYGAGSGTDMRSRIGQGITGAGIGATAGVVGNALAPYISRGLERAGEGVNSLLRRARGGTNSLTDEGLAVIQAGERQGIPIRQPDARPEVRADFAALEASPSGNPLVRNAMEADQNAVERRLGEIAPGVPQDNFSTGEMVQNAVARHRQVSKEQANALYGRVEQMAPDARIPPRETLRAVRQAVADIRQGGRSPTSQAEEQIIQEMGQAFSDMGITVRTVQAARKRIRGLVSQTNIDASATEARLLRVVQTAADELEQGLAQTNPQAAGALRTANEHWRDYIEFRDQVGRIFTGPANNPIAPEMAANRLLSMVTGKGDSARFSRIYQQLEPAERIDLAATIVQNLGTSRNGEFSLAALATNTSRANQRALREALGSDGYRALQDLRLIARAKADTAANLNNSRTGVVSARSELQNMVAGGLGAGVAGIPGMVAGFGARRLAEGVMNGRTARLLLNPDFTRWMRQMPNSNNPRVIQAHFARLERIASQNAVVAADVRALDRYLRDAFAQSPGRAAASGQQEQDSGQIPPQP